MLRADPCRCRRACGWSARWPAPCRRRRRRRRSPANRPAASGWPFADPVAGADQQSRHRPGERREHAGGLIVVEVDHAGGVDRLAGTRSARRCRGRCAAAGPASALTLRGRRRTPAASLSGLGEQPASARERRGGQHGAESDARHVRRTSDSVSHRLVLRQIRAAPPAAAQRLEQRRGVGVATGLGLHEADPRLLIGLLGAQQRQVAGVAVLPLPLGQIERDLGGVGRGGRRLQRPRRPARAPPGCRRRSGRRSAPCCDTARPPGRRPPWRRAPGAAASRRRRSAAVRAAPRPQKPVPEPNTWPSASAVLPASAVSWMFGRRLAAATPIWALAACRLASACSTSGRCATSAEGRLTGRSCGRSGSRGRRSPAGAWLG